MDVKLEGLDKVMKAFKDYPAVIKKQVDGEFRDTAERISGIAQRKAPVDVGRVRQSISVKGANADYTVIVQSPIGIVQEFGTGKYAGSKTAPEFLPYAQTFKGIKIASTGTLQENILGWVKRKGIGQGRKGPAVRRKRTSGQKEKEQAALAFVISRAIARDGIRPHPFLLEAFADEKKKLIQRLIQLLRSK